MQSSRGDRQTTAFEEGVGPALGRRSQEISLLPQAGFAPAPFSGQSTAQNAQQAPMSLYPSGSSSDVIRQVRPWSQAHTTDGISEGDAPSVNGGIQSHSSFSPEGVAPSTNQTTPRPSRKRQRIQQGRMAFSRRRAVAACQLCRARKTKCDNQRPSCGACRSHNAECTYQDQATDCSAFDQASLAILDRLNYAIQLIERQPTSPHQSSLPLTTSPISPATLRPASLPIATSSHHGSTDETMGPPGMRNDNATTMLEALDVAANCSSSSVLRWSILEGHVNADDIDDLFFDPDSAQPPGLPSRESTNQGRGIREEDVPGFVQDFLSNVHIKNPILDPSLLRATARRVLEEGFQWDGPSCLVLITCALANLAAPFKLARPEKGQTSRSDARDYATAETYYTAARKRIGLLANTVQSTQCSFLIGVYEMYSLRPLRAWMSFITACNTFQTYLHTRSRRLISRSAKRVEQRLYWSCLKSECEMREVLDLPPSGLAKVDHPDVFPSPPGGTPEPEDGDGPRLPDSVEPELQRSWYYYLSEIALRRIANRISHALHGVQPHEWPSIPLSRMRRIAEELDAQILQWLENIPNSFMIDEGFGSTADELTYMLHGRFLELRERIWRPFLYLQVHTVPEVADAATVATYAARCLGLAFEVINRSVTKHRHHGSWYQARSIFTQALLVLAAVKSGKVQVPPAWTSSVELALTCLEYWEEEAADLRLARRALADIFVEVKTQSWSNPVHI